MKLRTLSFKTRISLLCTALAAVLLLALGGLWLNQTRNSIHEELEAASRVAGQWLVALDKKSLADNLAIDLLREVGRIRANGLEVLDAEGTLRYRAPHSSYKAGRRAPDWFTHLVQPEFSTIEFPLGTLTVRLIPDASRATLDAWDDLSAMAGWAVALLGLLFLATRYALNRTLHPLMEVMAALDKTGSGQFATRLPLYPITELQHLAKSFNTMNDRLDASIRENVHLQSETAVATRINQHLEDERKAIARELHDELAQGITAVRALAGAIARQGRNEAPIHGAAQSILAVASEMQLGIKAILQKLRPTMNKGGLAQSIEQHLLRWQVFHPEISVHLALQEEALDCLDEAREHALLRMVQEGLTNAARHAEAHHVWIELTKENDHLSLDLRDDGRGLTQPVVSSDKSGFGLAGLEERLVLLGGELLLRSAPEGGLHLHARLPHALPASPSMTLMTSAEVYP
ncbi:MAG TPA: ATP-binding protein [Rhodocyclaceae bacterium]|jgi:two-component system sensor histidine kinase UhpB